MRRLGEYRVALAGRPARAMARANGDAISLPTSAGFEDDTIRSPSTTVAWMPVPGRTVAVSASTGKTAWSEAPGCPGKSPRTSNPTNALEPTMVAPRARIPAAPVAGAGGAQHGPPLDTLMARIPGERNSSWQNPPSIRAARNACAVSAGSPSDNPAATSGRSGISLKSASRCR